MNTLKQVFRAIERSQMLQVDIISDDPRHRKWTVEEKLSILAAAFAPGATVREIARRANVSTSQLYTWRKKLMNNNQPGSNGFAPPPMMAHELPVIELEAGGHKVRIPGTMPPAVASMVVRALVQR
jgi:transposase